MPRSSRFTQLSSTFALLFAAACAPDVKSGLNPANDSLIASQPVTADTIRSSGRNPTRLAMEVDTLIRGSADSTSTEWLSSTQRMAVGDNYFALFSGRNLKVFDASGKHLWSTSRYEFAPGQARNAKKIAMKRGGNGVEDWLEFTFDNDAPAPGAVLSASGIQILRDSIVIVQDNGQINIYSRAGRSISIMDVDIRNSYLGPDAALSASAAGWLLLQRVVFQNMRSSTAQRLSQTTGSYEFILSRVSLANGDKGALLRSLKVEYPGVRVLAPSGRGQREIIGRPLFVPNPIARISNGITYWTTALDFSFDLYDEYGRLKRVITVDTDVVPVTPQLIEKYAESASRTYRTRAADGDSSAAFWLREVLPKMRELPLPKHRPVIGNVWIGDDGSIAVRRLDLSKVPADTSDSLVVDILGADGRYRGRIAFEQPGRNIIHFTGSAFYVAEKAGVLVRSDSSRVIRSQGRDRAGNVIVDRYIQPDIVYQRLVRYTIK